MIPLKAEEKRTTDFGWYAVGIGFLYVAYLVVQAFGFYLRVVVHP